MFCVVLLLGANNCVPYVLCYESMGMPNPDFLGKKINLLTSFL